MAEHASHPMLVPESCLITFGHTAQSTCSCKLFAVELQWCLCDLLQCRSETSVRSKGSILEDSQIVGPALDAAVVHGLAKCADRWRLLGDRLGTLGALVMFFDFRHVGERRLGGWTRKSGGVEGVVCLNAVDKGLRWGACESMTSTCVAYHALRHEEVRYCSGGTNWFGSRGGKVVQ